LKFLVNTLSRVPFGSQIRRIAHNQLVLRSLLRFAAKRQYIPGMPVNLPSLKRIGQSVLEIPSDEHVTILLARVRPSHQCSFTLMSDAGLRPNEVRALRRRDVQLR
jgi:integrase